MDLETLKNDVSEKLAGLSLEELVEVASKLSVNVPPNKQGKKSATYRCVSQYLLSDDVQDDDDEGLQVFTFAQSTIDGIIGSRPVTTPEVKVELPAVTGLLKSEGVAGSSRDAQTGNIQNTLTAVATNTTVASSTSNANTSTNIATMNTSTNGTTTNTSTHGTTTTTTTTQGTPLMTSTSAPQLEQLAAMLLQQLATNLTTSGGDAKPTEVKTEVVRRLTDFKVNGVVGNGPGQLDYSSLMYRIRDGKAKGYKPAEIISGVVAAMKPDSELRKLFESIPDMSEEKFHQLLKGHYRIQSATNILTELSSCGQESTQEVRDYVAKMIRLKNTLTIVAEEENFMNPDMIYDTFINAVNVGLRSTAIRLELQPILLKKLPDEMLSFEVNKIVTREEKHMQMMGVKGLKANTNVLDVDEDTIAAALNKPVLNSKDDIILAKLDAMSADMKSLATVKEDVKVLGNRMDGYDQRISAIEKKINNTGDKNNNKYKNKNFIKCDNCEREKKYCTHCHNCGEGGHKAKDCQNPKK